MICRAAVQGRLKIRPSALVGLPWPIPIALNATWFQPISYFSDKLLQPNLRRAESSIGVSLQSRPIVGQPHSSCSSLRPSVGAHESLEPQVERGL